MVDESWGTNRRRAGVEEEKREEVKRARELVVVDRRQLGEQTKAVSGSATTTS
jgi:hypothetical protein